MTLSLIAWKAAKDWSGWHLSADSRRTICGRDVPDNGFKAHKRTDEPVPKVCAVCTRDALRFAEKVAS